MEPRLNFHCVTAGWTLSMAGPWRYCRTSYISDK